MMRLIILLVEFMLLRQVSAETDPFIHSVETCYKRPIPTRLNFTAPYSPINLFISHSFDETVADCICHTPGFAPTIENWWLSGATVWLKEYTQTHTFIPRYQELGLIGFLAEDLLKKTNFKCGIDSVHRCVVECQDVIKRVGDPEVARIVWFVLRSAGNIVESTKIVHDTLTAAQINMAQIAPAIANNFYWNPGMDDHMWAIIFTHAINTLSFFFGQFFPIIRGFIQINQVLEGVATAAALKIDSAIVDLQVSRDYFVALYDEPFPPDLIVREEWMEIQAYKERRIKRLSNNLKHNINMINLARMGFSDIFVGNIGTGINSAFGTINSHINYQAQHPGYEKSKEVNELNLNAFIRHSSMRARGALKKGTDNILSGVMMDSDGTSIFSNFTMAGNFLPDRSGNAKLWRDHGIEKYGITRGLMLKTLNAAINSQAVYITCSKDFRHTSRTYEPIVEDKDPVATCKKDNSGPKDFKACINGYCCYLYKWNNRGWAPQWRNERLFGADTMTDEPWNISLSEVITSSVQAYFGGIHGENPSTDLTKGIFHSLGDHPVESLWDTTTPGMFTIPVCFSDYNWATIIDGYKFPVNAHIDSQPRNPIKNLPCNCGPWGRDTEQVWKEVGLWNKDPNDRWFKDYTVGKCGFQIYDKIKDPVERYVAYCRVHVHTELGSKIRHTGKHWECDIISDVIKKLGYPGIKELQENDPQVYQAIRCHISHYGTKDKKCKDYNEPLEATMARLEKYNSSNDK